MNYCSQCGNTGRAYVQGTTKNSRVATVCACKLSELNKTLEHLKDVIRSVAYYRKDSDNRT